MYKVVQFRARTYSEFFARPNLNPTIRPNRRPCQVQYHAVRAAAFQQTWVPFQLRYLLPGVAAHFHIQESLNHDVGRGCRFAAAGQTTSGKVPLVATREGRFFVGLQPNVIASCRARDAPAPQAKNRGRASPVKAKSSDFFTCYCEARRLFSV